ncbi:MAG: hypothetical protein RL585_1477 [Pseudomonadota bacterium]
MLSPFQDVLVIVYRSTPNHVIAWDSPGKTFDHNRGRFSGVALAPTVYKKVISKVQSDHLGINTGINATNRRAVKLTSNKPGRLTNPPQAIQRSLA